MFDLPNSTQIPNDLFDQHLREMTEKELKVVLAVLRHTLGNDQQAHEMSLSYLADITGMSQNSVVRGAAAAQERGLIKKSVHGNSTTAVYRPAFKVPHAVRDLSKGPSRGEGSPSRGEGPVPQSGPSRGEGSPSRGEGSPSRGEGSPSRREDNMHLNMHACMHAFLELYGKLPSDVTPKALASLREAYDRLGETEYRRLLEWSAGAARPLSPAGLAAKSKTWKPARGSATSAQQQDGEAEAAWKIVEPHVRSGRKTPPPFDNPRIRAVTAARWPLTRDQFIQDWK